MGTFARRVCFGAIFLEGNTQSSCLLKLKMLIPWDQAIALLSMHSAHTPRKTCTRLLIAALFVTAKNCNQKDVHQ